MDDDKFYVPNRLEIKPGAFYFVAKCPNTKKILAIERDPDRGSNPLFARRYPCIVSSLPREAPIRDVRYYPLGYWRL